MKNKIPLLKRLYIVICPNCHKKRKKIYKDFWAIRKGLRGKRCFKCSRFKKGETNDGGFRKGSIPHNKGKGKATFWYRIKCSKKWKDMRRLVFERDKFMCQQCGRVGGKLEPHHIKSKTEFPKLVFSLRNIITLCRDCHRKTDNYGYKARLLKVNK